MSTQPTKRYFHRDLSWLLFNRRVIQEAQETDTPLLERLRFLAIAANNLDEFYMVRVPRLQSRARLGLGASPKFSATAKKQEKPKVSEPDRGKEAPREAPADQSPQELLEELRQRNRVNLQLQYQLFEELRETLAKRQYLLKTFNQLTVREAKKMSQLFKETIFPTLAPVGVDAYHAFPRLLEKALHLWVELEDEFGERREAILPISLGLPRLLKLSARRFLLMEEVIAHYLHKVFVGHKIKEVFVFRITYDRDLAFQEDPEEDLSLQMSEYLELRKEGRPSRLEVGPVAAESLSEKSSEQLREILGLESGDVYRFNGPLDLRFLFSWVEELAPKNPQDLYPKFQPLYETRWQSRHILNTLDHEDLLLHHPYDSFAGVLAFLKAAVKDPTTVAIKQTLYRLAADSEVVALLKKAAKKGIQVTVLVEIKARFDEANNLHWVTELEEAGCFVSYGFPNMKTHSKAILVVQNKGGEIKRYAQFGTGNYNEKNSQIYTDLSFFTSREEYVSDLTDFFNYLTGYRNRPTYQKITTSPDNLRELFLTQTEEVMAFTRAGGEGKIFAKVNGLTDKAIIDKLYEASNAGVTIQLVVRGACCLVPGVPGQSDHIQVKSIVGRFLEHSRIYAFTTKTGTSTWLSSADLMTRNLSSRVEIAVPMTDTSVEAAMTHLMEVYESDRAKAYFLDAQENYRRQETNGISAQKVFTTEALRKTTNLVARRQLLLDQLRRAPQ